MVKVTLLNFSKQTTTAQIKKSEKLKVRDIDEISPNSFVAYVDQDQDSYDVSLVFSKEMELLESNCDCSVLGLCIHKIALLQFMSTKNAKTAVTAKLVRTKKLSPADTLVESLDTQVLKDWLRQLLKKNKDLELIFVNEFTVSTQEYNSKDVKALIDQSIKSVLKNKKKIDANELKRVIDLLEITLKPVLDTCKKELSKSESYSIFQIIITELNDFNDRIYLNSVKLKRYVEKLSKEFFQAIRTLEDKKDWEQALALNFDVFLPESSATIRKVSFDYMMALYESLKSDEEQRKQYAVHLKSFFLYLCKHKFRLDSDSGHFLLEVFVENDLFEEMHLNFLPYRYENHYNLYLIDQLVKINQLKQAERIAQEQVRININEEYNIGYWQKLKTIYILQENEALLVDIMVKCIGFDYNFEDYLYIKNHLEELQFKKFRTNMMARAKRNSDRNVAAIRFYFAVLESEKDFKKMIESINVYSGYTVVYDCREELYLTDKLGFLNALLRVEEGYYRYIEIEDSDEMRDLFLNWVLVRYDKTVLEAFVRSQRRFGFSVFLKSIEAALVQ